MSIGHKLPPPPPEMATGCSLGFHFTLTKWPIFNFYVSIKTPEELSNGKTLI